PAPPSNTIATVFMALSNELVTALGPQPAPAGGGASAQNPPAPSQEELAAGVINAVRTNLMKFHFEKHLDDIPVPPGLPFGPFSVGFNDVTLYGFAPMFDPDAQ